MHAIAPAMNPGNFRTLLVLIIFSPAFGAPPSLRVSGGITLNGVAQPLLFTWNSAVPIAGQGWAPNEPVQILLHGPLDSPGVQPGLAGLAARLAAGSVAEMVATGVRRGPSGRMARRVGDISLGLFTADANGNLFAAPVIPFDSGIVGAQARIPRPGLYEVRAVGRSSGTSAAADRINLCPDTASGHPAFNWGTGRGGRDGI